MHSTQNQPATGIAFGVTERGDAGLDHSWIELAPRYAGVIAITKAPHLLPEALHTNTIVHCTITGLGGTAIEPGVAEPHITLAAYRRIVHAIGPERCVLRVDPIIPTERGLATAHKIIAQRLGRVRISYIDNYKRLGFKLPWDTFHAPNRPAIPDTEVCAEPGLPCSGCVSNRDLAALGLSAQTDPGRSGQRPLCACAAFKTELLTNRRPCAHGCLYCYWR
jgi:hypothetical protein